MHRPLPSHPCRPCRSHVLGLAVVIMVGASGCSRDSVKYSQPADVESGSTAAAAGPRHALSSASRDSRGTAEPSTTPVGSARSDTSTRPITAATTAATTNGSNRALEYALNEPTRKITLPKKLKEVSGLVVISATEVACIEDEDGVIFIFDLERQEIVREIRFGGGGDYEGLTRLGSKYFVLRSDGTIFEVDERDGAITARRHQLDLTSKDNEGICADPKRGRLLIAPKSRPDEGDLPKRARPIFAFDPTQLEVGAEPVLTVLPKRLTEYERSAAGHEDAKKVERFRPSSLAVHPETDDLFVISAADRALAVFDPQQRVVGYTRLDKDVFRQPEGITFFANGDLLISNEGSKKRPNLLRFRWNAKRSPVP